MHIVFCADRKVLPGLHVAAYSLLDRFDISICHPTIVVFSDALDDADMALLDKTLAGTQKSYTLQLHRIDPSAFSSFRPLNGSWATYYRLYAAQVVTADRFLYVDADVLCDVDVSGLSRLEMDNKPAAWVPEAPLKLAADQAIATALDADDTDFYFNAGVMLINTAAWREQRISERAMDYIEKYRPIFHDQSALNLLLHRNSLVLDAKFNCMSNIRKNWPLITQSYGKIDRLTHFIDYPKPWDFGCEWVHPQYDLWHHVLKKTMFKDFQSWHKAESRRFPKTRKALEGYKKSLKDRFLFLLYRRGWLTQVKGI